MPSPPARATYRLDFPSYVQLIDDGPVVVLGIVSSKQPHVETRDQLMAEIERATRHVDVAQLAISPQCGFASTSEGNKLSSEAQWAKLEAVARAADEVWGRAG
jgi:methionine synthase II (cobalamin-independent)